MKKSILEVLASKTANERQHFFASLANNLTLSIREVMTDDSLEDVEKNRVAILLNECSHRILNQVLSLYEVQPNWEDREIFEMIKNISEDNPSIIEYVGSAIKLTNLAREMEG